MKRRDSLAILASAPLASLMGVRTPVRAADARRIVIAEPLHGLSYLPLYIAIENGYFKPLDVSVTTLMSGSTHTDATIAGRVWGNIGGPEHNAYAYLKGINVRGIVNVVNRGSVYFAARKGLKPTGDLKTFLKGKTIATNTYGSSQNSILRYVLFKNGLNPKTDITLLEVETAAIPVIIGQSKADIAVSVEPMLSRGVESGIWDLFYSAPKELGPYAFTSINVGLDELNRDPATAKAVVEGVLRGLAFTRDHRDEAMTIAQKTFPDIPPNILKSALGRCYEESYWQWDGKFSAASVATAEAVARNAGLLTADVPFNGMVDTRFLSK